MIKLSDNALLRLRELRKKNDKRFVRLDIKGGGCAGFEYPAGVQALLRPGLLPRGRGAGCMAVVDGRHGGLRVPGIPWRSEAGGSDYRSTWTHRGETIGSLVSIVAATIRHGKRSASPQLRRARPVDRIVRCARGRQGKSLHSTSTPYDFPVLCWSRMTSRVAADANHRGSAPRDATS